MDRDQQVKHSGDDDIAANTVANIVLYSLVTLTHQDSKVTQYPLSPFYREETEAQRLKTCLRF